MSELAEAMNTLKGQKLAEEENQKTAKKIAAKTEKEYAKLLEKSGFDFRENIPLANPAGAEQIKTGAGKRKSMSLSA